ncbi:MAG: phosphatase PAP2 family protein [Rhodospirillaceae bacterium]
MMPDPLHRALVLWGVATAITAAALIQWIDVPVATFFYAHRESGWVTFFTAITDLANGVIWYSVCLVGVAAAARHSARSKRPNPARLRQEVRAWVFMAVSMASSGILINAMKFAIGRQRPRFLFEEQASSGFYPFGLDIADSSFPSGHTQSIWTAMLALSFLFPPLRPWFLLMAATIGFSRIAVGAHFFADVVASIFIAFATVLLWRRWFTRDGIPVTLIEARGVTPS